MLEHKNYEIGLGASVAGGRMQVSLAICKSAADIEDLYWVRAFPVPYVNLSFMSLKPGSLYAKKMLNIRDIVCLYIHMHIVTCRGFRSVVISVLRKSHEECTDWEENVNRNSLKPFKMLCYATSKPKCSFRRNNNVCFQNKSWFKGSGRYE